MQQAEKKQVLLCGTGYGRVYLPVIDELREFEVAALLARGSDMSVRLSEQRAITLYQRVDEVQEHIDLACVAVGGEVGAEIAAGLLERGVPVLLEHPVSIGNIDKLSALADKNGTFCHVNSHFPLIKPIADFIGICRKLNLESRARVINIACNSRTLFSMLDILKRCFGDVDLNCFSSSSLGDSGHYENCSTVVGEIPCAMVYQRWRSRNDDSKDSPLGHEITVTYPEGVLRLGGTFGPCQWFPLAAGGMPGDMPIYDGAAGVSNLEIIEWRKAANKAAIDALWQSHLNGHSVDCCQRSDWLKSLAHSWSYLFERIGLAETEEGLDRGCGRYLTIRSIME